MNRIFLFAFALLSFQLSQGQQVQWASEVIKFSSQFEYEKYPGQYLAKEALGAPSHTYPTRATPCAWVAAEEDSDTGEYLLLGFETPQQVRQIIIGEPIGAGAIDRIMFKDTEGKTHKVFATISPGINVPDSRLWTYKIPLTDYKVSQIRIDLKTNSVPGFNQIDAVGISAGEEAYKVKIDLAEDIRLSGPIENLGKAINSSASELCPVISPDGKTLYFTRMDHPENIDDPTTQDIWFAELGENNQYLPAKNIGRPLNNALNSSLTSISPDGQNCLLLNVYLPDGDMDVGISTARRSGDTWGQPKKVMMDNFYNDNAFGEYCLSSSGKVMIITNQRDDSEGAKDLYVSFRKDDASWSEPKLMGPNINTVVSESSPFLGADDRTLYFSTAGLPGYGSNDMFVTRRLDDTWVNWSDPKNLGPQLNTPKWDAYYSLPASGEYVYFVSYSDKGEGEADIYRAPLPPSLRPDPVVLVRGKVTDKETGLPLGTDILYVSLTTGKEIGTANSDPVTGNYSIVLPAGDLYGISAGKENYLPISDNLDLRELKSYEEIRKDLELSPLKAGASMVLNNLYFDTGAFKLREESYVELKQMKNVMDQFPNLKAEIGGHTDNVGNEVGNISLSENRAKAVQSYLVSLGITKSRLQIKGFGEKKPLVANDTENNRQINRRVEFSILSL